MEPPIVINLTALSDATFQRTIVPSEVMARKLLRRQFHTLSGVFYSLGPIDGGFHWYEPL